jgi:hypothetical protein
MEQIIIDKEYIPNRYILLDQNNNKISVHDVEISSDYIGIMPVLPMTDVKLKSIGKRNIYLSNGYKLQRGIKL